MKIKRGWLAFLFVTFVLYNSCASHQTDRAISQAFQNGTWRWTAGNFLTAVSTYGTNDADILRYLAYSNATLGRPYQSYYVRPLSAWMQSFSATSEDTRHADDFGVTTPSRPLVPYRDFLVEYPPGFFLFALPPACLTTWLVSPAHYPLLFSTLMALCLVGSLWSCQRMLRYLPSTVGSSLAMMATLAVLAIGVISTRRYDAAVSLLLCLLSWALLADKIALCGALLGLAIAVKGVPVLIAPVLAALLIRQRRLLDLAILAAVCGAVVGVVGLTAVLLAGRHVLDAAAYHGQRPLQIESTYAAVLGLLRPVLLDAQRITRSFGSINLSSRYASTFASAATFTSVAGIGLIFLTTWRRLALLTQRSAQHLEVLRGVVATLGVFMVSGKVFSPQYLVWLLPLGLMLSLDARRGRWLLPGILLLTQLIYPVCYGSLMNLKVWAFALVLLRNGLLIGWIVTLYRPLDTERCR